VAVPTASGSRTRLRVGLILTALAVLFLTFDTVIKVAALAPAVEGTIALGYPAAAVRVIRENRLRSLLPLRR